MHLQVRLHLAVPVAIIEPRFLDTGLNPGSVRTARVKIKNIGFGAMTNTMVVGPSLPWVSVTSETNLGHIQPNESATFDVFVHPPEDIEGGVYEDEVRITARNHPTVIFPIRVIITPEKTGTLVFLVKSDKGIEEPVPDATVTISHQEVFTLVFNGVTDSEGKVRFDVPIGRYTYRIHADLYDSEVGTAPVEVATQTDVEVNLRVQFLRIEWSVLPTKIKDEYVVTHNIVYETKAPVPYVDVSPSRIELRLAPGETSSGQLELTNRSEILSVFDVKPRVDTPDFVSMEFAVESVPEIRPLETVIVPYVIRFEGLPLTPEFEAEATEALQRALQVTGDATYEEVFDDMQSGALLDAL